MRDVAFYYRRKRGLGRIKDKGLADVFVGGRGITIKVKLTSASVTGPAKTMFKVKTLSVKVEELKFAIREASHSIFSPHGALTWKV